MLLFLLLCTLDQYKIDGVLSKFEQVYQQNPSYEFYCQKIENNVQRAKYIDLNVYRQDIIIGDEPAETLNITGSFNHHGNIFIINDGVLIVRNADFNLDGDIYAMHQGYADFDSSNINFIQHYIYHHLIALGDSARVSIKNSITSFRGYPFNVSVQGNSNLSMNNIINNDWITAVVANSANADLRSVDLTGEWLFINDCHAEFRDVDYLLTWYFFEDSTIVDFAFPQVDTLYNFHFDSTLPNVTNVGYSVVIDSSTQCMWAAIPLRGSDIIIRDSQLRVTGLMFEGADSFDLSGLVNGLHYNDWTLPVNDRNYRLINTDLQTWNLYPNDSSYVYLHNSIFGELCGFSNSYSVIENAFCDGSGGHIEASHNAIVFSVLSSIMADVITKQRGLCFMGYCSMPWGMIWATGASIMIIVNCQFPEDPVVSDTSIVFVGGISGPSTAEVDDTVNVTGSAWIDVGPYQPLDFWFYRMFYREINDSNWLAIGDTHFTEVRRSVLDQWITVGLNPATYELRLVLKDNVGDSIEAFKQVRLNPSMISEKDKHDICPMQVIRLSPCCFAIRNFTEHRVSIYDAIGRKIAVFNKGETVWHAPASGVYFAIGPNDQKLKLIAF